jgi:hypothetical protein
MGANSAYNYCNNCGSILSRGHGPENVPNIFGNLYLGSFDLCVRRFFGFRPKPQIISIYLIQNLISIKSRGSAA